MIMNKKVSTIFAMAALMGGSLFSSAYAADLLSAFVGNTPTKVDLSKQYFIQVGTDYLRAEVDPDTKVVTYSFVDASAVTIDQEDVKAYLWTLSASKQANGKTGYEIKNAESGELIRINASTETVVTTADTNDADYKDAKTVFYFGNETTPKVITDDNGYVTGGTVYVAEQGGLALDDATTAGLFDVTDVAANANTITLKEVAAGISVDETDLNDLYNSAGFNFALNDSKLSDVTNIFNDKKVLALKVNGATKTINDVRYEFPAGTYFVTATPWTLKESEIAAGISSYDFLVGCTFIAIDSDENILDDSDEQKAGNGFTLTEISGKNLVTYKESKNDDGTWSAKDDEKSRGNQIAVANACFSVKESTTIENLYELTVEGARVVEASTADKQIEKDLKLTAGAKIAEVYTTSSTDPSYIFKFSESTIVKPIDLLHKGDTATIVNIRFYKANGTDNSYNAKYLTTNAAGSEYVAKGKVLADLDAPAYQWVISAADANNNVTFQNRETGMTFKTQLFDEGNGIYSLAPAKEDETFNYYLLTENGDVKLADVNGNVENLGTTDIPLKNIKVELIESKATNYAGYVNVDTETLMTLSFGRDIAPTSNKLYPFVTENGGSYYFDTFNDNTLTSEVGDAAQWLLIRHKDARSKTYNYVYANGNLVNTKNNGDAVYAAKYAFQLVLDGKVVKNGSGTPYYLTSSADVVATNNPEYFSISENVDGSVNVMTNRAATDALLLDQYYQVNWSISQFKDQHFSLQSIDVDSEANDVKTYLIAEAPAISLPAVEGHYSFVSELSNYITMDENRDALAAREESDAMYLYVTDKEDVVPSFYVTLGKGQAEGERMFLFCPEDSVNYYVATGSYDKKYQWDENQTKAIFKSAKINESRDTLTTSIKGESTLVAKEANNTEKVEGGIERFKMQIVEAQDADGMYVVRQVGGDWLYSINGKLSWTPSKNAAMKFDITGAAAPTANEGVSATEVKVIATDGAINIKNAAGKNVVISTILGQIVANEVLTSDNATISVPAGIAIVSVDGEEAVKVSVK